ncbi:MAG: selenium cofactor biosynthesis protein YqeC [Haloferacaceae archaeon]
MALREAFPGRSVAVVGAGGKKTTLYALAAARDRAVVTSTVRIPPFPDGVRGVVTDDPVGSLGPPYPLGLAAVDEGDRLQGYDPPAVDDLVAAHDGPVLVKADGARTRLLKAPGENEPQIPATVDTVVPVASVRAVGEPLDGEVVHRPERVAAVTGRAPGEPLAVGDLVEVLASPAGALKGVPSGAAVVPLVNMADDDALAATAREVARGVLDRAPVEQVVVARMDEPTVLAVLS